MPQIAKAGSALLSLSFVGIFLLFNTAALLVSGQPVRSASKPTPQAQKQAAPEQAEDDDIVGPEDVPADEELAPAALQLDLSKASPLIQQLYQATRETKENAALDRLSQAKALIVSSDVKATDTHGRTALHWAVFGSSYTTKPKLVVAYEEVANELIERGVDINREDLYQDTALDYLLYSPNFEMQTLLIEHGATSGFLAASTNYFDQIVTSQGTPDTSSPRGVPKNKQPLRDAALSTSLSADLKPGQTLSVRLAAPVYSDRSRTGDPIEGTVTYPLCKNGEQLACNPGELLVPPGTRVNGTVLFAQKAPNKYSRPRLVLDFSNVLHSAGQRSSLYARVIDVDNARETVRNNEILGIVQPHAPGKAAIAMAVVSATNPIAGYALKGMQTVYGLSIRREILFPAGTDLQIQIVRPSRLKAKEPWSGWPVLPMDAQLQKLVTAAPLRVHTSKNESSDMTNLMFLGTREQVTSAFNEAGWFEAEDLTIGSALKTVQATFRQTGYSSAPVSSLLLAGQQPDLVFQKSLDTFAKRHHLRIWKQPGLYNGQEIWVGAATHDIAVSNARKGTKWSHRIDPHIDRERDWIQSDLLFIGSAVAYRDVDRPNAPRKAANATGDDIVTDGKMTVVQLNPARNSLAKTPTLAQRQ